MPPLAPDMPEEIERLRSRLKKLAEEKSHLQLLLRLFEQLNPLQGVEDMVVGMLQAIAETIGGTNVRLYYWDEGDLLYSDLFEKHLHLSSIDDGLASEAAEKRCFIEKKSESLSDALLQGDVVPDSWNWAFPLMVGDALIGIIKLENIHIIASDWRNYLPILFNHLALILSNELRNRSRQRAEEKLLRWSHVFEHAGWGIAVNDAASNTIVLLNPAFAEMHGFTVEEMLGTSVSMLFAPSERKKLPEILRLAAEQGHITFESAHIRKNGSIFPVLIDLKLVDEPGQTRYRIANIQDISQIKESEEQLRRTVDALTQSNVELERFAHIASHDLQEPLRTLVAYSQLLERRYRDELKGDAQEFLDLIISAAKRMHTLVLDLLAYSHVSTQGHTFILVDMQRLIEAVRENLKTLIQDSRANIVYQNLPSVLGDEIQLLEVVQNLISNAIKFRRKGVPLEISVRAERKESAWVFSVADNGIGIEPSYFDRIFVIFQRLHSSAAYPGSGVGLAVCKRIIERHGGHIWVESEPGKGSTFYFTLPIQNVDVTDVVVKPDESGSPTGLA